MDSQSCNWFGPIEGDCRGVSPVTVFFDIVRRNFLPTKFRELLFYMSLAMVAWYALVLTAKFVVRQVKPVLIVVAALFLYRLLRTFYVTNKSDFLIECPSVVLSVVSKVVELFKRLLD